MTTLPQNVSTDFGLEAVLQALLTGGEPLGNIAQLPLFLPFLQGLAGGSSPQMFPGLNPAAFDILQIPEIGR